MMHQASSQFTFSAAMAPVVTVIMQLNSYTSHITPSQVAQGLQYADSACRFRSVIASVQHMEM
jgi:hypothetical protein